MKEHMKAFILECLLFQTDRTYNPPIPTWVIGVLTWIYILLIVLDICGLI